MNNVVNLFVIAAFGVILADLVAHVKGTTALFGGIANLWTSSVNGMLGQTSSTSPSGGTTASGPTATN